MPPSIAALFVHTNGIYFGLPDVTPYDGSPGKDARLYAGPHPVVAHPPCERWSKLATTVQARYGIPIGTDDGCFASALRSVRQFGGVLEHPEGSFAFKAFGIGKPEYYGGWTRSPIGGYICRVEQGWYGHPAAKPTWLYAVIPVDIAQMPALKWGFSTRGQSTQNLSCAKTRGKTPIEFRDVLLNLAKSCPPLHTFGLPPLQGSPDPLVVPPEQPIL